jgi:HlyD family secretion protein
MRSLLWQISIWVAMGSVLPAGFAQADDGQPMGEVPAVIDFRPGRAVSALGRLEPKDGLIQVAGPSQMVAVVKELLVDEGDRVEKGQVIAVLDTVEVLEARVARARAERSNAKVELSRNMKLHKGEVISDSRRDEWQHKLRLAQADLQQARADLSLARVKSPIDGRVIEVHAREGERIGDEGIVELGRTDEMYAIAEVYETDIGKLRMGQRAVVRSPALAGPLEGTIDRIGLKVGHLDAMATDPAARTDARVVEVDVKLDDSASALGLTNLQVEVEFEP